MAWVYVDHNPLTADERVFIDSNRLTADEVVYVSSNWRVAHKRVFVDDNPLTAQKRVFVTSNKHEAGPAPPATRGDFGGYRSGGFSSPAPCGMEHMVATIWGCFTMFGVIAWILAGGGGDPHAGRIPLILFGGGALAFVLAWLSGVIVDDGERFALGIVWTIAGIVPLLVVADHRHSSGDGPSNFMSSAVVASGVTMFSSFLLCVLVLAVIPGKRQRRRPWFPR